jgi:hypothetical protein
MAWPAEVRRGAASYGKVESGMVAQGGLVPPSPFDKKG